MDTLNLALQNVQHHTDWETIAAAFVLAVLGPIVVLYMKNYWSKRNIYKKVNKRIQVDAWITGKLGVLLGMCSADRAYVFQVHPEHEPMYISETYEVVAPGVSTEMSGHQNLALSEFNYLLAKLLEDKTIFCEDVNDIRDNKLRLAMRAHGTKSVFVAGMFNSRGDIKGFLAVDYVRRYVSVNDTLKDSLDKAVYDINPKLSEYQG